MNCKRNILILSLIAIIMLSDQQVKADFVFGESENSGSPINTLYNDGTAYISPDGLSLYFGSDRPGGHGQYDIWVTTRPTKGDDWREPLNLGPTVNRSSDDGCPSITADGLSLYFGSNREGGSGGYDIWITTRASVSEPWGEPVNLGPTVNSDQWDGFSSVTADGLSLFFGSNREKIGTSHSNFCYIYKTTRPTRNDPWGEPVRLGPTVNPGLEYDCDYPSISADGRILFFSSNRPGGIEDSWDIWMATRPTEDDEWDTVVNLGPTVNDSFNDIWPSISPDGSTLFFLPRRPGGLGGEDIWQVSIDPIVDLNNDGIVDSADMCIIVDNWGTDDPLCDIGPMPWGDGIVDVQDMVVLAEYLTKEKVDVEADIVSIEEVLNQYAIAVSTGDLELFISIHTDDTVNMAPDAPATSGKEELRASVEYLFTNFTSEMILFPEETQVDGDLGFARGNYTLSITPNEGGEPSFTEGKYLTICKRQADSSWKISRECHNSNVPPIQE